MGSRDAPVLIWAKCVVWNEPFQETVLPSESQSSWITSAQSKPSHVGPVQIGIGPSCWLQVDRDCSVEFLQVSAGSSFKVFSFLSAESPGIPVIPIFCRGGAHAGQTNAKRSPPGCRLVQQITRTLQPWDLHSHDQADSRLWRGRRDISLPSLPDAMVLGVSMHAKAPQPSP